MEENLVKAAIEGIKITQDRHQWGSSKLSCWRMPFFHMFSVGGQVCARFKVTIVKVQV
jgi:hypothetical protein